MATDNLHELHILEQIERNPDATQADLAAQLGVAIGTVNWYIKRLVNKGFVKVTRLQRRRLRYLVTTTGMSEKAKLAYQYVQVSMYLYRTTRSQVTELLTELRQAGYDRVCIEGTGDLVDVCRLTCIEHGIAVRPVSECDGLPRLLVSGTLITLNLPPQAEKLKNG